MLGDKKGHYVNQWVNTSLTTPLPGLCTSGDILPTDSDVIWGKISHVQRPGNGVVRLVLTHWFTWCPQIPPSIKCGIEKNTDRCAKPIVLTFLEILHIRNKFVKTPFPCIWSNRDNEPF